MKTSTIAIATAAFAATASAGTLVELTTNGGFEAGDTSGWEDFTAGVADQSFVTTMDASSGNFAGLLTNNAIGAAATIKQANIGVGQVGIGDTIFVQFDAKGSGAAGGVAFAEMFQELAGGGTSGGMIFTGAPLTLTDEYQTFNFEFLITGDVSGGITLQFNAATGANPGSESILFVDNVSVAFVPAPASMALLGLGGLAATRRRR